MKILKNTPLLSVEMSDEELENELQKLQKRFSVFLLLAILSGVLLLLGVLLSLFILTFLGLPGLIVFIILCVRSRTQMKRLIAATLIQSVVKDTFDDAVYDPAAHLSDYLIASTDMGFPFHFDEISGSDYIRGTYHGLSVEMSDVRLVDIKRRVDKDGHVYETRNEVFRGLWMVCDFGKELRADLRLSERSFLGKKFAKGGIKTDSEEFNKRFYIASDNEHEVFYVLTPHMMEYITEMDEKGKGNTYMRFVRAGKVHIAINSDRDSFEIRGGKLRVSALRAQFEEEIKYVTDLIDELRLVDTLTV